nr:hypothetical protein [uncultured Kingella sp.]
MRATFKPFIMKGFEMLKGTIPTVCAAIIFVWVNRYQSLTEFNKNASIALFVLCVITYVILDSRSKKSKTRQSKNDDDDIFLDNAPNPVPPPTNPPTSEQIEFMEFMKQKRQEQEREKELIRRE